MIEVTMKDITVCISNMRFGPAYQDIPPISGVPMLGDISGFEKIYIVCGYTDYEEIY